MSEERISILRYWTAGLVLIIVALIVFAPWIFLEGFFSFLTDAYGFTAVWTVYVLVSIILVPYIYGRIIKWISQKILQL